MASSSELKNGYFGVICAILAAVFNFTGMLVLSLVRFGVIQKDHHHHFSIDKLKALDVTYIRSYWHHRRDVKQYEILAQVFIALAWGLQLVPLLYVTSISSYDRGLANAASGFFVAGTLIAVLDFLLNAGTIQVLDWITTWPLNNQDWRSLEISYMISSSRNIWLLTVDWYVRPSHPSRVSNSLLETHMLACMSRRSDVVFHAPKRVRTRICTYHMSLQVCVSIISSPSHTL